MKINIALLTLLSITFTSVAQESASASVDNSEVEFAENISSEFSIPAIPALEFISSDPSDISRPSNIKKLAASLYNGIDENGNVKQGLAVELKVAEYIQMNISPEQYKNNQWKYMLYNTQLSLGTIATSGDSTRTDLGWGLRVVLFDNSDPMRNKAYLKEFEDVLADCGKPIDPTQPITEEELTKCMKDKKRPIKESFDKEKWNASWMTIAYAGGTRLNGSQISEGKIIGHQAWVSGGLPLGIWGQFSYLTKWSEAFNDDAGKKIRELEIGGKLLAGKKSYNLFIEASYNPVLNKDDFKMDAMVTTDNSFSWTAGIEFKISDGVWVVAGLGEEAERIVGDNGIQLLSGIRMGISDKTKLKK